MNEAAMPTINLQRGYPNPRLLPTTQIKAASVAAFSDADTLQSGLLYGEDAGYEPLRRNLAIWLTDFYKPHEPITPSRLAITGGASQNLACILQTFSDPLFTSVWLVSPVYFLACGIFEDNGFHGRMRSVPEDEEGIDIAYLQRELAKSDIIAETKGKAKPTLKGNSRPRKVYRHLIYAVPNFSNPSSNIMSLRRRHQLVETARRHDALIITDDVYDKLQWPATKGDFICNMKQAILPRIVDVDRFVDKRSDRDESDGYGNAVSNGSFSKIAGPGCRTGWAEANEKFTTCLAGTWGSQCLA